EVGGCGPVLHPVDPAGQDPDHRGLLQHDLGDEDRPGRGARTAPGEIAAVDREPGDHGVDAVVAGLDPGTWRAVTDAGRGLSVPRRVEGTRCRGTWSVVQGSVVQACGPACGSEDGVRCEDSRSRISVSSRTS